MAESDYVKKDPLEILLNIVGLIWINGSLYLIDTHTDTCTMYISTFQNKTCIITLKRSCISKEKPIHSIKHLLSTWLFGRLEKTITKNTEFPNKHHITLKTKKNNHIILKMHLYSIMQIFFLPTVNKTGYTQNS